MSADLTANDVPIRIRPFPLFSLEPSKKEIACLMVNMFPVLQINILKAAASSKQAHLARQRCSPGSAGQSAGR